MIFDQIDIYIAYRHRQRDNSKEVIKGDNINLVPCTSTIICEEKIAEFRNLKTSFDSRLSEKEVIEDYLNEGILAPSVFISESNTLSQDKMRDYIKRNNIVELEEKGGRVIYHKENPFLDLWSRLEIYIKFKNFNNCFKFEDWNDFNEGIIDESRPI